MKHGRGLLSALLALAAGASESAHADLPLAPDAPAAPPERRSSKRVMPKPVGKPGTGGFRRSVLRARARGRTP